MGLALVGAVLLAGAGAVAPEPKTPAVQRLLSPDPAEREQGQRELLEYRARVISELSAAVAAWGEDNNSRMMDPARSGEPEVIQTDSARRAIYILGEMRATEAAAVLTANLGFPCATIDPKVWIRPDATAAAQREVPPPAQIRHYRAIASHPLEQLDQPAVEAMLKIGEPCLGPLLEGLASNPNTVQMGSWIRVLLELRGHDGTVAMLKEALAEEKDPARRARLQKCWDILEKVK
jgi:hypothetical protein